MKSTCQLIILNLFIHSFSFGQSATNYGPFPKISDNLFNVNYLTESYVILNKYSVIGTQATGTKKNYSYYTFDLKPNASMISQKVNINSGAKYGGVFQVFFTDSYIIEFIDFSAGLNPNMDIGAVKRDRKSLEMVGEVKMLDEKLQYCSYGPNVNVRQTSTGYVYTRIIDDRYVVSFLDQDFNEVKKIPLTDEIYKMKSLNERMLDLTKCAFQVSEKDELFIIKVKSNPAERNTYKCHFTVVKPDGEVIDFEPSLDESIAVTNGKVSYLNNQEEIEGIFTYSTPEIKGSSKKEEGYKYYRWDLTGKILESKTHVFTVDEVYEEYKGDLLKKFSEEDLNRQINSRQSSAKVIAGTDGNYLVIHHLTSIPLMMDGFYIVKLDKKGGYQWSKMLPSAIKNSVANFHLTADGHLRMLLEDATSNSSNDKHEVDVMKKVNTDETSVFDLLFDKNTGKLLENKLVNLDLPEGSKFKTINLNEEQNKYLIESINGKNLYFSVVEF